MRERKDKRSAMRVAITGGTGFVGRHLAQELVGRGHEVVLIAQGRDRRDPSAYEIPHADFFPADLTSVEQLTRAFGACGAVAHCAGINREIGKQTYKRVHVQGTRIVMEAAQRAGVGKVSLLSFLRARPDCGSGYHESKWAAEEIVRGSGVDYTILKPGVIYGRGDHMLDHLSHALHTFPVFALVGFERLPVRPVAVEEVARVLAASLTEGRLPGRTVWVLGPEEMTLEEAVKRVGQAVGKRPIYFRAPVSFHRAMAAVLEHVMRIPLVSRAQVRILSEGIVQALPECEALPGDLTPRTPFSKEQIRKGLPEPGGFRWKDLRWAW